MKSELHYAYAVARTRAVEGKLLDRTVIEQLISAADMSQALRVLRDHGWEIDGENISKELNSQLSSAWTLLNEAAPHKEELEVLTVLNDYHNLKAAVKCVFSGFDRSGCYLYPTSLSLDTLEKAVDGRDFSLLPEHMRASAKEAYEIAAETANGQRMDTVIDIAALSRLGELSKALGSPLMRRIALISCAVADIKVAIRSARAGKDRHFIKRALCPCEGLELTALCKAASEGEMAVLDYIDKTEFSFAASALRESTVAFERLCDDELMKLIKATKWQAFGLEPLLAYYYGKVAEIKAVRTVLGAKQSGVSAEEIRERVGELYV